VRITGSVSNELPFLPYRDNLIEYGDLEGLNFDLKAVETTLSKNYELYLNSMGANVGSLNKRCFNCEFRNPDFNFLTTAGTTPITNLDPSDTEIVKNWFAVFGGGNTFSITPTAYTTNGYYGTGSRYYLNLNVSNLVSEIQLYNLNYNNYSNSIAKYSNQIVSLSGIFLNNLTNFPEISFTASDNTGILAETPSIVLEPGYNLVNIQMQIPDLSEESADVSNPLIFNTNLKKTDGTCDTNIYYLKSEISDSASPLIIDHNLENLLINSL